jgi:hypothetical protein
VGFVFAVWANSTVGLRTDATARAFSIVFFMTVLLMGISVMAFNAGPFYTQTVIDRIASRHAVKFSP